MKRNQVLKIITSLSLSCSMVSQLAYPILAEEIETIQEEAPVNEEIVEQEETPAEEPSVDETPTGQEEVTVEDDTPEQEQEDKTEEEQEVEEEIKEEKDDASTASKPNVTYHSQAEIQAYVDSNPVSYNEKDQFSVPQSLSEPYSPGKVADSSLQNAVTLVNQIRYIAGLDPNVTIDERYNELSQATSFIIGLNGKLDHEPVRPSVLNDSKYDELYETALEGASSNLSYGRETLAQTIIHGWMADNSSTSNLKTVGHRRWLINPKMGKIGFGVTHMDSSYGKYYAQYSWDESGSGQQTNVVWPAQETPVQYFLSNYPWSISTGEVIDTSTASVELTRKSDNQTWNFNSTSADGIFNINNEGYGQEGCIIFRPDSLNSINAGDSFHVKVKYNSSTVEYDVNFFTLNVTHEHEYGDIEYSWNDDLTKCIATITCVQGDYSKEYEATVTRTGEAKCEEGSWIKASATVTIEEKPGTHSTSARSYVQPVGHDFAYTSKDENTHTKKCKRCDLTEEEAHTFENDTCTECNYKNENIVKGECGDKATWTFDTKTGELIIKGTGETDSTPWLQEYANDIKKVVVEEGITKLYWSSFQECINLTSVKLPDTLTDIGSCAFTKCTSLEKITLPSGLSVIPYYAFSECTSLKSITIPSNVKEIDPYAFYKCNTLTSITIPTNVNKIYGYAFADCDNLKQINVDSKNTAFTSENGILFNKNKTTLVQYPKGKTSTSYEIPSGVNIIGGAAFVGCSDLKSITIPNTVEEIWFAAFGECSNLKRVVIPSSVKKINGNFDPSEEQLVIDGLPTFESCTSLEEVIILNPDIEISEEYAFLFDNCPNLKTVYCNCDTNSQVYDYFTYYGLNIKPVNAEVDDKVTGYSLSLSGNVGVNFYMSLMKETVEDPSSKVTFTLPDASTQSVNVSDAKKMRVKENAYYVFPCHVSVKDLTGTIQADLIVNDEIVKSFTYTVQDYANYILEHYESTSNEYNIASSLMTYGYYTQQYFGYKTDQLPTTKNELTTPTLSVYQAEETGTNDTIHFIGGR